MDFAITEMIANLRQLPVKDVAGWVASAATIVGAMVTASNLGPRVTGWGFAVFSIGSLAWITTAALGNQQSLLVTSLVLALVNMFGTWRWLGRQSQYRKGSQEAAQRSQASSAPSLFPLGSLVGMSARDPGGRVLGTIVEAMLRCDDATICYLVINDGSPGGIGESLRAVEARFVRFSPESVTVALDVRQFLELPVIHADAWPVRAC